MGSLYATDYVVIIIYFLLMLGIGIYLAGRSESTNDYFAGGNKIPWWISGVSLYMTNFSAWIFSGAAGFIYHTGYYALIYLGISGIAFYGGSQLTAAYWRRSRVISPVEYTNTRYNNYTQVLLGIALATVFILSAGVQLAAIGKLLAAPIGIDMSILIIGVGIIVLVYTYSGGLWAVNITDFVQFIILIAISLVVLPLSLNLVGGLDGLLAALPPLSFEHVYNNVYYDEHYLAGILLVTTVGVAAGGAQRFFSVADEKSAKKVGKLSGILFLSFPFIFGVPPLVARILWPDLSQVSFFQNMYQPEDLVFLGVVFKVLPLGLIGMFFAALLAATMSALSSVYNLVSAIIARDIYKDTIKKGATDKQVFIVGRIATLVMGMVVIFLALSFVYSDLGIFNLMITFFALLNLPINIPIAFGLLFKWIPRWGAFGAILLGFYSGLVIYYILGWSFGPQIYFVAVASFSILIGSAYLGELYETNRKWLVAICLAVAVIVGAIWITPGYETLNSVQLGLQVALSIVFGAGIFAFSKLFSLESEHDRQQVEQFFKKLHTPVDVAKEVYAKGGKITSTFPLVGTVTMLIGGLVLLIFMTPVDNTYSMVYIFLSGMLIMFGFLMYYFGKRSESKSREKYQAELKERGLLEKSAETV